MEHLKIFNVEISIKVERNDKMLEIPLSRSISTQWPISGNAINVRYIYRTCIGTYVYSLKWIEFEWILNIPKHRTCTFKQTNEKWMTLKCNKFYKILWFLQNAQWPEERNENILFRYLNSFHFSFHFSVGSEWPNVME